MGTAADGPASSTEGPELPAEEAGVAHPSAIVKTNAPVAMRRGQFAVIVSSSALG